MNSPIKVLALNDDNHETCFVTYGSYFFNSKQFMKECLLKSHTSIYEVRGVYICEIDEWEENCEELDEMFDKLACCYYPEKLAQENPQKFNERTAAFDKLWEIAEKDDWYV